MRILHPPPPPPPPPVSRKKRVPFFSVLLYYAVRFLRYYGASRQDVSVHMQDEILLKDRLPYSCWYLVQKCVCKNVVLSIW